DTPKDTVKPADLLKTAAESAQVIEDPTWKIWVLVGIAEAQAKVNEKDAAGRNFQEALAVANAVTDSKDHRLADVARAQAKAGDKKGAKATADRMEMEDPRAGALAATAPAQATAGDFKGAEETIASVTTDVRKGEALRALIVAQVKAGKLKEAAKTAGGIVD